MTMTDEIQRMIADGGREIDGRWLPNHSSVTTNCLKGRHPHTDAGDWTCNGWIAPLTHVSQCFCPCHDKHRMPWSEARAITARICAKRDMLPASELKRLKEIGVLP
jgi:hypothetical protein